MWSQLAGLGRRTGRFLRDAAVKDPFNVGSAAIFGIPSVLSAARISTPEYMARDYQGRQIAAAGLSPRAARSLGIGNQSYGDTMKISSSVLSNADIQESLRIYRSLEKSAASKGRTASQLADQLVRAMGLEVSHFGEAAPAAARAAKQSDGGVVARMQRNLDSAENARVQNQRDLVEAKKLELLESRERREQELHEKEMRKWTPGQLLMAGLGIGSAATLVGMGSTAVGHAAGLAHEKVRELGADKRYSQMLKVDPSLKEEPHAKAYFQILDRASPYIASEPYLAAATVQQMVSTPSLTSSGVPAIRPEMLSQLLKTEQARQETRFPFIGRKDPSLKDIAALGG